MSAPKNKGVFCIEAPWTSKLTDRGSVRPLLEVVEGFTESKFIFRDVSTVAEVERLVTQWTQKQYASHPFGIFSFHGHPGGIMIGRKLIRLDELGEVLAGRCKGRLIHFDSCEVLKIPAGDIEEFRARTGATAVSGFTKAVDMLEGSAFTLNLLSALIYYGRISTALSKTFTEHQGAAERLGFRAVWASGQLGVPKRR